MNKRAKKYRALFVPKIGITYNQSGVVVSADVDWDGSFTEVSEVDGREVSVSTESDHPVAQLAIKHMDAYLNGRGTEGASALLRHVADLIDL